MNTTTVGLTVVFVIIAGLLYAYVTLQNKQQLINVTNFEECAAAGNPVMESYPRQCRTPDGQLFVEEVPLPEDPYNGINVQANGCAIAGCSGQLCVSAKEASNIFTTCEYRPEYACYKEAKCEPQANGACGWTETPQLRACLNTPPQLEDGGVPQAM